MFFRYGWFPDRLDRDKDLTLPVVNLEVNLASQRVCFACATFGTGCFDLSHILNAAATLVRSFPSQVVHTSLSHTVAGLR